MEEIDEIHPINNFSMENCILDYNQYFSDNSINNENVDNENVDKSLNCCMAILSGTLLEILRLKTIKEQKHENDIFIKSKPSEDFMCPICLGENIDEDITCMDCGHDYHISCIKRWNKVTNTCPMCIQILKPKSMKVKIL